MRPSPMSRAAGFCRVAAATALIVAVGALVAPAGPAGAAPGHPAPPARPATFTNPVSAGVADTFADPSVIRGRDGSWYAFGTSDPLRTGETRPHLIPILRSADLVHWTYVADVFTDGNRPEWSTATAGLWAPDIRYVNGRYVLYFTVTDTTLNAGDDSAIGVATAPGPAGPWTDSGGPLVAPRPAPGGGFLWTFDPAGFTDATGRRWLYFGSYFGGIFTVPLTVDGLRLAGAATQVAVDNRYEGAYVVRHGGFYYLFGSAANCCAGPTTGYSVFAGRSTSPTGPFVDRDGVPLLASRVGGTPVIQPNGNRWVGTGHNAVVTDLAGQDWLVYHAIDRAAPYLNEPYGINRRPMLIDRLDWIGGWPTVRAGRWASDGPQPAPLTAPADRAAPQTAGTAAEPQTAGTAAKPQTTGTAAEPQTTGTAAEPHTAGTAAGPHTAGTAAGQRVATVDRARSDEFGGGALAPGWTWIRRDDRVTVSAGALRWPVQAADLVGDTNSAAVLLRDAPAGGYVVETKVSLDLGVDTVRNYQQAGLVVYAGDDDFARLSHVAIWNTRQIEYGREIPYAGRLSYGGMVEGPPGGTTWLRVAHRVDRVTGEHEYRAGYSRDGAHWTWGGTWTFAPGTAPRIGLVAHGGATPPVTAAFDYFRVYV